MKTTLSKIADIRPGYPFRSRIKETADGTVAVVQMKNVNEIAGVNWGEGEQMTGNVEPAVKTSLPGRKTPDWLTNGDVLFAARGDRNLAICLQNVPTKAVCSPHFFKIRVIDEQVLPEFVAWQINQQPAQHYLRKSSGGTLIRNIRRSVLENLPVVIPPIQRQQLIMGLDKATKSERANLEARIESGRAMLSAIAQDLIKSQQ